MIIVTSVRVGAFFTGLLYLAGPGVDCDAGTLTADSNLSVKAVTAKVDDSQCVRVAVRTLPAARYV